MKKKLISIMIFLIVLIIPALLYLKEKKEESQKVPKRLSTIPVQATWVGGVDGGNWYQITRVLRPNTFQIRIYNENSGQVETDTSFALNFECSLVHLDSLSLLKNIEGYDGEKVLLNLSENGNKCFLVPR
jgi:hypothetical protein